MKDLDFMARAIELAKKGQLKVQPKSYGWLRHCQKQ